MTTPQERMRALRWGAELLVAIQQARELKSEFRSEASRLVERYPGTECLAAVLEGAVHVLPPSFGTTIEEAWILFQKVQVDGTVPCGLRRQALFTLRHFPLPGTAFSIEHAFSIGRIDEWLAHEAASATS